MRNVYTIEEYKDAKGEFRWRMKRHGRVICDSGEGYKRLSTMRLSLKRMHMGIASQNFHINRLPSKTKK